ncbi:hypothetical protein Sjap_009573 [Stephania japonica]|uniref:Glycosyltransferase n=1 Tax=Stephania japonica TaxID=461633 RepID=A0AAP0JSE6_9MAGN
MEQEVVERSSRGHVVVLPFPAQGHINPAVQLAKCLASKGLKVTVATTLSVAKSLQTEGGGSLAFESFSDGCEEDGGVAKVLGIERYLERFESYGSKNLGALIEKYNGSDYPVNCLVYDSGITWALHLAKRLGILGASLFTQTCAVSAIYHHVYHKRLILPIQGSTVSLPGFPILERRDLPSFVDDVDSYPFIFHNIVLNQFSTVDDADFVFFNTFDKLEEGIVEWVAKQWPNKVLTVGPSTPSIYLGKQDDSDKDYDLHVFAQDSSTCMNWLNTKENESVVYVSYGSVANMAKEQMDELAWGLRRSGYNFLWVVRATDQPKLPDKLAEETAGRGLIVTWCPQLEVLAHRAVGGFLTHCGWNSTLEALALQVPMVAMPQWTDQMTNAKFVQDVWKVGIRTTANDKGIVGREEIERCVVEVMEGERRVEIKKSLAQWNALAKEAVNEGGSSDKNIQAFAARLL